MWTVATLGGELRPPTFSDYALPDWKQICCLPLGPPRTPPPPAIILCTATTGVPGPQRNCPQDAARHMNEKTLGLREWEAVAPFSREENEAQRPRQPETGWGEARCLLAVSCPGSTGRQGPHPALRLCHQILS